MSKTIVVAMLLSFASSTGANVLAADLAEQSPPTERANVVGEMTVGSASSSLTKAEIREIERQKEMTARSKDSKSDRALMIMRSILSY